jgi:hypothetical protein
MTPTLRAIARLRRRSEEGVALITALLVSFVVLALAVAAVSISHHNLDQSSYDRRRVQAIAAAEAGVDYYFSHVASVASGAISCSLNGTVGSGPGTFAVQASFFDSGGSPLACGTANPSWVLLESTGRAKANVTPARKLQAYVRLTPGATAPFDNSNVLYAHGNLNFKANTQVGGSQYNDANIYVNGNVSLAANSTVYGNLNVQGSVTMGSNSEAKGDVLAGTAIVMESNSKVRGNATSSTSTITLQAAKTTIYKKGTAAGTVTGGTVVEGRVQNVGPMPLPPTKPYPTFNYVESDWTAAGYTPRNYDSTQCGQAVTDIGNWFGAGSGSYVLRVSPACTMTFTSSVTVKGNLAIITDGSFVLNTPTRFTPATGTGPWNVLIFAGLTGTAGCNVTANTNTGFDSGLKVLVYTHENCTVNFDSNSAMSEGQVMGGTINYQKSSSFKFAKVAVPGTPSGGLNQDVVYKREIK